MAKKAEEQGIKKELVIRNALGLHARAATRLVETASRFVSEISLEKDGNLVDAKADVLSLIALECAQGSTVRVRAKGEDSRAAVQALSELFNNNFGE